MPKTLYGAIAEIADDYYPEDNLSSYRLAMNVMRLALRELAGMTCAWAYDDVKHEWGTECDSAFHPEDGMLFDSRALFCPSCGKWIAVDFSEDGERNE